MCIHTINIKHMLTPDMENHTGEFLNPDEESQQPEEYSIREIGLNMNGDEFLNGPSENTPDLSAHNDEAQNLESEQPIDINVSHSNVQEEQDPIINSGEINPEPNESNITKKRLLSSIAPDKPNGIKKQTKPRGGISGKRGTSINRERWSEFAREMVSEEDIREFKKDMRNKKKSPADELKAMEEAKKAWAFGMNLGLRGNDEQMVEGLKDATIQVSRCFVLVKENTEKVS